MLKRCVDILGSACALVLFSPVFLVIAWKVSRTMGTPVFFRQVRAGHHGKSFEMIKFRSMKNTVDEYGKPLPDEERITPFGHFLRNSSLDELPELWNVLKGDMSLVGPRPLLMEYLPRYTPEQNRRHDVKPGISGWAQVNGRNAISWEEKFNLDVWYVENYSFLLDLKIIIQTVKTVFVREGISANEHVTMPPFRGSNNKSIQEITE